MRQCPYCEVQTTEARCMMCNRPTIACQAWPIQTSAPGDFEQAVLRIFDLPPGLLNPWDTQPAWDDSFYRQWRAEQAMADLILMPTRQMVVITSVS